ncbi:MAG: DEAD/DEAH box helicase, partial [Bradyrhizobium sp.]
MPPPRILPASSAETTALLPDRFRQWFAGRGWLPREHQLALLAKASDDRSALLIAPTGAGKTLAGFLPTLVELSAPLPVRSSPSPLAVEGRGGGSRIGGVTSTGRGVQRSRGLHTLYISPLKALAVDIARNLETPIAEMALPIKVETRTGDTPVSRRQRQRRYPPDILLTTPEQLALLLSSDDAPFLFASLERIVLDELHALVTSKRGDLLSLGLARLWRLAPELRAIGLSATVAEPESLARFLVPQACGRSEAADIVVAGGAAAPVVEMLDTRERLPWAGHTARHALGEIYDLIRRHNTTLVFV